MNSYQPRVQMTLHGTLVGRIWWPQVVCSKHVKVDLTDQRCRYSDGPAGTLRHIMDMHVTNDGDFQSCALTKDSFITLEVTRRVGSVTHFRRKVVYLVDMPSMADFLTDEEPEFFGDSDD